MNHFANPPSISFNKIKYHGIQNSKFLNKYPINKGLPIG